MSMLNYVSSTMARLDTFVQTLLNLARFRSRSTSPSFGDIYGDDEQTGTYSLRLGANTVSN